jgi:hypothetical protein
MPMRRDISPWLSPSSSHNARRWSHWLVVTL